MNMQDWDRKQPQITGTLSGDQHEKLVLCLKLHKLQMFDKRKCSLSRRKDVDRFYTETDPGQIFPTITVCMILFNKSWEISE